MNGQVLAVNRSACEFYGLSESEMLQRSFDDFEVDTATPIRFVDLLQGISMGVYPELMEYQGKRLMLLDLGYRLKFRDSGYRWF